MTFSHLRVIIACHQRRELTVRAVRSMCDAAAIAGVGLDFVIFDDGSTDGTRAAVESLAPGIQVLSGDGNAFWAKGMAVAETRALSDLPPGAAVVWMNDDVLLDRDAVQRALKPGPEADTAVIVCAMRDSASQSVTYSGMRRRGLHPLSFRLVLPARATFTEVDTFNGNLVFVPVDIARKLGGIDGNFSHALADIDYGLRCGRLGVPVLLAPGTYGICPRNPSVRYGSLLEEWRTFVGPKGGGNFRSLKQILRKSHRLTWPVPIAATYVLWWLRHGVFNLRGRYGSG